MKKIKQVLLSLFVVVVSAAYVVVQPQKVIPVIAQTNIQRTLDTQDSIKRTPTDSEDTIVLTVPKDKKVSTSSGNSVIQQNVDKIENPASVVKKPIPTPVIKPKPIPSPIPTPIPKPIPKGQYIDGVYTSTPVNAYYGTVQVKTTVIQGKITSVDFLQYPDNRRTSRMINKQAMPALQKEVIAAQSAKVSGVSGATYTSKAFRKAMIGVVKQATG